MVMISTQVSELELEDFQGKVTQNVVLPNVSWQTYKALLADMGDHRAARLTYDQGILQIKMPSKLHEIIGRVSRHKARGVQDCDPLTAQRLQNQRKAYIIGILNFVSAAGRSPF